jgi:hypothetical protein
MEEYKNLEQNLDNSNEKLHISDVSCSFSAEELERKATEFYEFWYDKYGTSEIDEIERRAVIHAFLGGCKFMLENCN